MAELEGEAPMDTAVEGMLAANEAAAAATPAVIMEVSQVAWAALEVEAAMQEVVEAKTGCN